MQNNRYRLKRRRKFNQEAMQAGRARARMARPVEPRPPDRNGVLCEQLIRRRFVNGVMVEERIDECYGTRRVDSLRVVTNGVPAGTMGMAKVYAESRKAFLRVLSARSLE